MVAADAKDGAVSTEEAQVDAAPSVSALDLVASDAANFVHEIINPLTNLSLTVQLLERRIAKENPDPVVLSMLQQMTREMDRMQSIISSFRTSLRGTKSLKGE
jgi:signal transduction histidine kinase